MIARRTVRWQNIMHMDRHRRILSSEIGVHRSDHLHRTTADWYNHVGQVKIDILSDDILLCIFNVHVNVPSYSYPSQACPTYSSYVRFYERKEWRALVQVCRRWRTVVFESPYQLQVQLFCSNMTPVPAKLDIWPVLPIVVFHRDLGEQKLDNLIAAIKHNDRICKIDQSLSGEQQLQRIVSAMQVPFPALTDLKFTLGGGGMFMFRSGPDSAVLPELFLGRSAPRLQHLDLSGFSFPGLPNLLLSATGLVSLELWRIPHSWDISPDAMVTHLSALNRLELLTLEFKSCRSRPDWESRQSPPTRTLIPALTRLKFEGANKYAEGLVIQIDAPRLDSLEINFFNKTVFNISHLSQFISRVPRFQAPDAAYVEFSSNGITLSLLESGSESSPMPGHKIIELGILCDESAGELSSFVQLCGSSLPAFTTVERLYIYQDCYTTWCRDWKHLIDHSHWLRFLHLFSHAKNLYVTREIRVSILPVLEKLVGERATEVLPALQNLVLDKYTELSDVEDFIDARKASGHPISVSRWTG